MNRHRFLLLVASLCLVAVASANDNVTKQLEANYTAITKAFKQNNLAGIESFLTKDFSARDLDGKIHPRAEILTGFKSQMAMLTDVTWVRKVSNLSLKGNSALVTVDGKFNGTMVVLNGKPQKFQLVATAKDSWIQVGNKWLLKGSTVIKRAVTVDGKLIKMP